MKIKLTYLFSSSIQFWSGFIPVNGVARFTPLWQQSLQLPLSISLDSWHPFSPNQHSCSPSRLVSSTSSLVVLASSCPSLQTPMLFSKHAHHPSSTHACTVNPFTIWTNVLIILLYLFSWFNIFCFPLFITFPGESGLGKSTLLNSLFLTDLYTPSSYPTVEEKMKKTVSVSAETKIINASQ